MPPNRLRASPIEVTVTSSGSPRRAKGGRLAVTITAATLRLAICSGVSLRSKLLEQVGDRLAGRPVARRVAGAGQAGDQPVADDGVVAPAGQAAEVLDADAFGRCLPGEA